MNLLRLRIGVWAAALTVTGGASCLFIRAVLSGERIDTEAALDGGLWLLVMAVLAVFAELAVALSRTALGRLAQTHSEMERLRAELRKVREDQPKTEELAEVVASYAVFKMLTGGEDAQRAVGDDTGTHNVTHLRPR